MHLYVCPDGTIWSVIVVDRFLWRLGLCCSFVFICRYSYLASTFEERETRLDLAFFFLVSLEILLSPFQRLQKTSCLVHPLSDNFYCNYSSSKQHPISFSHHHDIERRYRRERGINVSTIMSILFTPHVNWRHPSLGNAICRSDGKVQSSQKMWVYPATPTNQLTQFRERDTLHIVMSLAIWVRGKWATSINHRPDRS